MFGAGCTPPRNETLACGKALLLSNHTTEGDWWYAIFARKDISLDTLLRTHVTEL